MTVMRMEGVNEPDRGPLTLLNFHSREDMQNLALGCDSDIGGTSKAHLDFVPDEPSNPNSKGKGKFWGDMRLQLRCSLFQFEQHYNANRGLSHSSTVRPDLKGKIRTGYAGFRSKVTFLSLFRVACLTNVPPSVLGTSSYPSGYALYASY